MGLACALYGSSRPGMVTTDDATTARELAMFRGFEPGPASPVAGSVLITYGVASPEPRHRAARALADRFSYAIHPLPDASHFVAWDSPSAFASAIRDVTG